MFMFLFSQELIGFFFFTTLAIIYSVLARRGEIKRGIEMKETQMGGHTSKGERRKGEGPGARV